MATKNTEEKQRTHLFQPGQSGNPAGRPPGSLNKATMAAQALLDGEAEALTRKAVEMALEGSIAALRLCLERICPPRKESPLTVELPVMERVEDLPKLTSAIIAALSKGEIMPGQAMALASLVENCRKIIELAELEKRISALESNK